MPAKTAGGIRLRSRLTTENEIFISHCYIPVSVVRHVTELMALLFFARLLQRGIPESFRSLAPPPFAGHCTVNCDYKKVNAVVLI